MNDDVRERGFSLPVCTGTGFREDDGYVFLRALFIFRRQCYAFPMSFRHIPFGTAESFNVVLEISAGNGNKYEYDESLDAIKLAFVFKDGFKYLYNYGYIPETKGGDGDHLDAIVLNPHPLAIGTIVPCRAIGMIELLDRGIEDNKIIAVPVADGNSKLRSVRDLTEQQLAEFRKFFADLASQKLKEIVIKGFRNKDRAQEELEKGRERYGG